MNENKILFVDDDPKILHAVERRFDEDYNLKIATGPAEGLQAIQENGPFAVVISDMRMPEMTGIEMLSRVREISPDTVRIMLTGFADVETTIEAINEGNIFRFLSKPCSNELMKLAMDDGIRQYNLIRAEKELVEGTLTGSVKVLSEVLGLVNPVAFGRASRVKRIVMAIASHMEIADAWEIEIAAMLSALGCVTLSESTLEKLISNESLAPAEQQAFQRHPEIGESLLENIPRLGNVARIVAYQEKHFDGNGFPEDSTSGDEIPLGARILKVALDFDTQENLCSRPLEALTNLKKDARRFDPAVLSSLEAVLEDLFAVRSREIDLEELREGMVFARNVNNGQGQMLIAKGQEVTESAKRFLTNFAERQEIQLPLVVFASE